MKFLALTMAIIVTLLAIAPCCLADDCLDERIKTEESKKNATDNGSCSPFFSCTSCPGFTTSAGTFLTVPILYHQDIIFFNKDQLFLPDFPYSVWQPPKLS